MAVDYLEYLKSAEWAAKRREAMEAVGFRCQTCNSRGPLIGHHRTYERLGNEAPGDITILCTLCHDLFHVRGRWAMKAAGEDEALAIAIMAEMGRQAMVREDE